MKGVSRKVREEWKGSGGEGILREREGGKGRERQVRE